MTSIWDTKNALTVFTRAALAGEPEVIPTLVTFLQLNPQSRMQPAIEVAQETARREDDVAMGMPIVDALRQLLATQGSAELDDCFWALTSKQSNALAPLNVEVGHRRLQRASDTGMNPRDVSGLLMRTREMCQMVGRSEEALDLLKKEEALGGSSTRNMLAQASVYCDMGGPSPMAVTKLAQAYEALCSCAAAQPAAPRIEYWRCVLQIAQFLDVYDDPEAIALMTALYGEVVSGALYGEAVSGARVDRPHPELVSALQRALPRYADLLSRKYARESLPIADTAVALYRDLVMASEASRDAWNHRLADTLRRTAACYLRAGRRDVAVTNVEESIDLFQSLCRAGTDYDEDLATALYARATLPGLLDTSAAVLATLEEARQIFVTRARVTQLSAQIYIALALDCDNPHAAASAYLGLFHILGYTVMTEHLGFAKLLPYVPHLAALADPDSRSPLNVSASRLANIGNLPDGRRGDGARAITAMLGTRTNRALDVLTERAQAGNRAMLQAVAERCLNELGIVVAPAAPRLRGHWPTLGDAQRAVGQMSRRYVRASRKAGEWE